MAMKRYNNGFDWRIFASRNKYNKGKYIHNVFKDTDIMQAQWVDNPLTLACKCGYTLIYNEFSRSRAVANNVLLSIFSEGILELPTQFGEER